MRPEKETYTLAEVAAMTGFSRYTITRLFERERGVLILERPESLHKRSYRSIRIPRAVYQRVFNRLVVPKRKARSKRALFLCLPVLLRAYWCHPLPRMLLNLR